MSDISSPPLKDSIHLHPFTTQGLGKPNSVEWFTTRIIRAGAEKFTLSLNKGRAIPVFLTITGIRFMKYIFCLQSLN